MSVEIQAFNFNNVFNFNNGFLNNVQITKKLCYRYNGNVLDIQGERWHLCNTACSDEVGWSSGAINIKDISSSRSLM